MRAAGAESEITMAGLEGGAWDREDFLTHARLILAVVCTILVCISPTFLGKDANASRLLILLYLIYSLVSLTALRLHWNYGFAWALFFHVTEVVIVSLITIITGGPQSLFLGFYLFVLLSAACKWGFNGALITSGACIVILFSDLTLPFSWFGRVSTLMRADSAFVATMVLSASLVSSACLLGLLVEREKHRYGDAVIITRLVRSAVPESSFKAVISGTLMSVREYFDADLVRLAIQEIGGGQAIAWDATRPTGKTGKGAESWKLSESARRASFAMPSEEVRLQLGLDLDVTSGNPVARTGGWKRQGPGRLSSGLRHLSTTNRDGEGLYDLQVVTEEHSPVVGSWSLLATSFFFEGKWLGRLTIYSPRRGRNPKSDACFLGSLVREVGPAVYGKYLVGRLRSRAQAHERARLSQDLHDGIVQSLIGLEMQIDVLRRTQGNDCQNSCPVQALEQLQAVVHNEIANLREEMQRVKPLEVEPSRFLDCMAWTVERFRRELGISASFVSDSQEVSLPARVCTELVRIVQEALANVRKHSGAHKVLVRFGRENGHYKLCVEDDGRGFGFTGRLSSPALEASAQCPVVIMERVGAIGGELMVESTQGSGARLEILLPLTAHDRVPSNH